MRVEQWADKWLERGEITQEEVDWVKTVSPKPGYICANIKTHKKGWPYRFIMSANETAIEYLARWIEWHLKEYAQQHETYIRDTKALLQYVEGINNTKAPLSEDSIMVSWDIKNSYPNCQTDLCIEAVGIVLDRRPQGTLPSKESISEALQITMSCDNATFLGSHFTQVNGATIRGPESACVTDTFGAEFIDQIAMRGGPIEPENWKRYRDDTLDIKANCTLKELEEFTDYLNENVLPEKIVFEMENSREKLSFLDVNIGLREGYLITEIYPKPTDSHQYLNPKSCHPPSVANNNQLGVALRVRRNCSDRIENIRHILCIQAIRAIS